MTDAQKLALTYAAAWRDTSAVEKLIAEGADINALLATDQTAVMLAVEASDWNTAAWLAEHGADVNKETSEGRLIGSFIDFTDIDTAPIISKLESIGVDLFKVSSTGDSLLRNLIAYGKTSATNALIKRGADIHQINNVGESLVYTAVYAESLPDLNVLMQSGLAYRHGSERDDWRSPLGDMLGVGNANDAIIACLYEHGASIVGDKLLPSVTTVADLLNHKGQDSRYETDMLSDLIVYELSQHLLSTLLPHARTMTAINRLKQAFDLTAEDLLSVLESLPEQSRHLVIDAMASPT